MLSSQKPNNRIPCAMSYTYHVHVSLYDLKMSTSSPMLNLAMLLFRSLINAFLHSKFFWYKQEISLVQWRKTRWKEKDSRSRSRKIVSLRNVTFGFLPFAVQSFQKTCDSNSKGPSVLRSSCTYCNLHKSYIIKAILYLKHHSISISYTIYQLMDISWIGLLMLMPAKQYQRGFVLWLAPVPISTLIQCSLVVSASWRYIARTRRVKSEASKMCTRRSVRGCFGLYKNQLTAGCLKPAFSLP